VAFAEVADRPIEFSRTESVFWNERGSLWRSKSCQCKRVTLRSFANRPDSMSCYTQVDNGMGALPGIWRPNLCSADRVPKSHDQALFFTAFAFAHLAFFAPATFWLTAAESIRLLLIGAIFRVFRAFAHRAP
jgi:hypothetical protein